MCVMCFLAMRTSSNASLGKMRLGIMPTTDQSSEYRAKGEDELKKSTSETFKNQGHDDSFFRVSWFGTL